MYEDLRQIHLSDWNALTPTQQNMRTRLLIRRAHAARSRALGKVLLAAAGHLFGWTARIHAAALVSASAQGRQQARQVPRGGG